MTMHVFSAAPDRANPLAYTVNDAARVAGISRSYLYLAIKAGHLRPIKMGRRTLILHRDLEAWLLAQHAKAA